ncbi:MAG: glutamate decarboxylase [Firmicutes bacterium]|nr:glutamate decarboxylase [Bacillota bacterium]
MPRWDGKHPDKAEIEINPLYARGGATQVPRFELAAHGILPDTAYHLIHDELALDGNARLNLATFVQTWMEPEALQLYIDAAGKNIVDKDEYPQTAAIEDRCVKIIAGLWHAPDVQGVLGVSTTGSSEAAMLGGLVMKRRWQQYRRQQGLSVDRPNIVFSSAVQVVWERFANYFEVEPRFVPVSVDRPQLTADGVLQAIDDRTIGVVVVLGVTYTGVYEPVEAICGALDAYQARTGLDIPVHVDAASGGFVAPFIQPALEWDFRLPRVLSINASGHKYGLVLPGLGWALWRDRALVPDDLIFDVAYLGGHMPTFGLNFSRPGAQVLLQYYNFLRLGFDGYVAVQQACQRAAQFVAAGVQRLGPFHLLSDGSDLPVVAWRLVEAPKRLWDLHDLSHLLRERGWQVPAYPLPPDLQDVTVMRVVVRNGFSLDLAQLFLQDLERAVSSLEKLEQPLPHHLRSQTAFHH